MARRWEAGLTQRKALDATGGVCSGQWLHSAAVGEFCANTLAGDAQCTRHVRRAQLIATFPEALNFREGDGYFSTTGSQI
jgi:hypothetical protein